MKILILFKGCAILSVELVSFNRSHIRQIQLYTYYKEYFLQMTELLLVAMLQILLDLLRKPDTFFFLKNVIFILYRCRGRKHPPINEALIHFCPWYMSLKKKLIFLFHCKDSPNAVPSNSDYQMC